MKSTILLITLLFCINTNAQEAPELPMKNGYVYYEFNHDLNNSKRCLSYYNSNETFAVNTLNKLMALGSELKDDPNAIDFQFFNGDVLLGCSDTLSGTFSLDLPEKLPLTVFGHMKSGIVTAKIDIFFINKNSYKVTFKGFTCLLLEYDGMTSEDYTSVDLETFYNTFISKSKKTKYEIEIFSLIDNAVKGVDKLILESFKKAYETDEL
jgi:hypothetical protein